jgi:hypothetical protein
MHAQGADDRRILPVVIARHTIKSLAVVLHRLGTDPMHHQPRILGRLPKTIAVRAR